MAILKYISFLAIKLFFYACLNAQEGNYRYESYGNQSVLLSGNVYGSAEDLGLTFYNPARLAFIKEPAIVVAGKAFELVNYTLNDVFESDIDLTSSNFNGIPSIVSGTFKVKFLPNHHFAYSFISRYRSAINLDYTSGERTGLPIGDLDDVDRSFTDIFFRNRLRDEWYGITWSHKLHENFAIGATIFGSIYELNGNGILFVGAQRETGDVVNYTLSTRFTQKTYGLFFKLGASWRVKKVDLGLNLSLPFLAVRQRASLNYEEFLSGFGPEEDFFYVLDLQDLDNKRRTTTQIGLGAGIPIGKSKLHLSVDWASALSEYERVTLPTIPEELLVKQANFNEELRSVFNFGAGANIYISASVKFLVSFSSDYSATLASPDLFDLLNQSEDNINIFGDFWHFGFGPDLSLKWGKITLGATHSRSSSRYQEDVDIPGTDPGSDPLTVTTFLGFERWRFIVGLEIPLLGDKVKGLPIK